MSELHVYSYDGPVIKFGACIANNWKGKTTASSVAKAMSNLKCKFNEQHGMLPTSKIDLPGKIKKLD